MKIPLVGQSYTLRSPAAAIQQSMGLFPQFMDDPNEKGKNIGILEGTPGFHLMGNINTLGTTSGQLIRGFFAGGGRLFCITDYNVGVGGSTLWELGLGSYVGGNPSTGSASLINWWALPGSVADGKPGLMFGNGNQLFIVKNGYTYCDNGSGPQLCRFLISGSVNTASAGGGTSTVTWVSGDKFPTTMNGGAPYGTTFIIIDGVNYLIATYNSATSLTLAEDAGTQTGALYQSPAGDFVTGVGGAYLDTYFIAQRPVGQYTITGSATSSTLTITWAGGDFFDELEVGQTITFNGSPFVVDTIASSTVITVTSSAGSVTANFSAAVGPDLGRQFNISNPEDGLLWDPLDFATKEGYPDHTVSIAANNEQLLLQGAESMEVWQNTGNALFPFQRIPGAMAKLGTTAAYGSTVINEQFFFVGGGPPGPPIAYRLDGYTPTRISTHAEEYAWSSGIDTPSGAICYGEIHDGHKFFVVNFPGQLLTWVYDETASQQAGTPMWHQRANWSGSTFSSYLLKYHAFIPEWGPAGMHIVGDYTGANFHELNLNYFDDNGADKKWVRILPAIYAGGNRQFFGRMTLEMETGSTSSVSVQPVITRDYSDDRGQDWLTPQSPLTGGAGVAGAFSQRVFWPVAGSSRGRNFRIAGVGQYRTCLIDLDCEIEVGTS